MSVCRPPVLCRVRLVSARYGQCYASRQCRLFVVRRHHLRALAQASSKRALSNPMDLLIYEELRRPHLHSAASTDRLFLWAVGLGGARAIVCRYESLPCRVLISVASRNTALDRLRQPAVQALVPAARRLIPSSHTFPTYQQARCPLEVSKRSCLAPIARMRGSRARSQLDKAVSSRM